MYDAVILDGVMGVILWRTGMSDDIRAEAAQYYDVNPTIPDDIAFYQARLPSGSARQVMLLFS